MTETVEQTINRIWGERPTVSADDIRALRSEAEQAGDDDMVTICNVALSVDEHGDGYRDVGHLGITTRTEAIARCTVVILGARAMQPTMSAAAARSIRVKP